MSPSLPSVVICGSQTVQPPSNGLEKIRFHLQDDSGLYHFIQAAVEPDDRWPHWNEANLRLSSKVGEILNGLKRWATELDFRLQISETSPNGILAPLTVLIQLVQYILYLKGLELVDPHQHILQSISRGGFQGLCLGFLTATALACSRDTIDIYRNGAVALRLATLVGAVVDANEGRTKESEEMCCLVASWPSELTQEDIVAVLKKYPESYISVELDENGATITAAKESVSLLRQDLEKRGCRVSNIHLNGRYHSHLHAQRLAELERLARTDPYLQFPRATELLVPLRDNATGALVAPAEELHQLCLRCLLTEPANWYTTMKKSIEALVSSEDENKKIGALELGFSSCIPRSLASRSCLQLLRVPLDPKCPERSVDKSAAHNIPDIDWEYSEDSIAVIGAAGRFAGAPSLGQFWDSIRECRSAMGKVPKERASPVDPGRSPLYCADDAVGSFVDDLDAFDHGLFGISPHEALYMDPQQRVALQVAYEALSSSGYLSPDSIHKDVGCYVGAGASDYESNVNSHPATAFSYTGTARAFISGRISHYFGWTGPSMVIDTACSSSAVAIHQACKDLRVGDCSMALAGGVHLIANASMYQNLAAANFLGPPGPCRAFDSAADGYCRGEGCGFVLLKRFSSAVADHDEILGVISGSATNQNGSRNCSIVVPSAESQQYSYTRALRRAGIDSQDISYVEAHGTGTPVGDPIEWQGIRQIFGGVRKEKPLYLGSVKSNIGHTEAASGIAGLLKVLLMMRHGQIPPQANFTDLNPAIPPVDHIVIPTKGQVWSEFRAACINNIGAAGNNTALIVCQPPPRRNVVGRRALPRYPFLISAQSKTSLQKVCNSLQQCIIETAGECTLEDHAFNIVRGQNHLLHHRAVFEAGSTSELLGYLNGYGSSPGGQDESPIMVTPARVKPVVLAFAGQSGKNVHIHRSLYESCPSLRFHLEQCDTILHNLGYPSLFPGLFQTDPKEDMILLHCMLFALQYSCAAAWIGSGLQVHTVIGHSIGQLTALCIAGALQLPDALKLIAGRAALIQEHVGDERGCMLAVDLDQQAAMALVQSIPGQAVEIACYNGPSSQVLVGTEEAIQAAEGLTTAATRRLGTICGFHSRFMDCILGPYEDLARSVSYADPVIPVETCSPGGRWTEVTPERIVQHTRDPVYFEQAVSRIETQLGPCVWLEAGSGCAGINLARRALNAPLDAGNSFHGVQLGNAGALESLARTTLHLWAESIPVQFWLYHRSQISSPLRPFELPRYQFDEKRHWLPYVGHDNRRQSIDTSSQLPIRISQSADAPLISIVAPPAGDGHATEFAVNSGSPEYARLAGTMMSPVSMCVELATRAVVELSPEARIPSHHHRVQVADMTICAPLGRSPDTRLQLVLRPVASQRWEFSVNTCVSQDHHQIQHAKGAVSVKLQSPCPAVHRLVDHQHCQEILTDPTTSSLQGTLLYTVLSKSAQYQSDYRGIRSIAIRGREAVAHVAPPHVSQSNEKGATFRPLAMEKFTLVADIHALCVEGRHQDGAFACSGLGEIGPVTSQHSDRGPWVVYTRQTRPCADNLIYDTFVFDADSRSLVFLVLGARYIKTLPCTFPKTIEQPDFIEKEQPSGGGTWSACRDLQAHGSSSKSPGIWDTLCRILHDLTGMPSEQIRPTSSLAHLGVDSIVTIDLGRKINDVFQVNVPICLDGGAGTCGALLMGIESQASDSRNECTPASGSIAKLSEQSDEIIFSQLAQILAKHFDNPGLITSETKLSQLGLDSLVAIDLEADLKKAFDGLALHLMQLDPEFTFGDLSKLVQLSQGRHHDSSATQWDNSQEGNPQPTLKEMFRHSPSIAPSQLRQNWRWCAQITGFDDFCGNVHPKQEALVVAYIVEAFAELGCDLNHIAPSQRVPRVPHVPKHQMLVAHFHDILTHAGLIRPCPHDEGGGWVRTSIKPVHTIHSSSALYQEIMDGFPRYRAAHQLLHCAGSRLGDCLAGKVEAISLLFRDQKTHELLRDYYANDPMLQMGTHMLIDFLPHVISPQHQQQHHHRRQHRDTTHHRLVQILEIGAGTGGTTGYVLQQLSSQGISFQYTFTDVSPALVRRARDRFQQYDEYMKYMTLNVEHPPSEEHREHYDIIISTNCIHATKNLDQSCNNLLSYLRPGGRLCLLEVTRGLSWLDCVFGLLDGWWRFEDERQHAFVSERVWRDKLLGAGFRHVDWTHDEEWMPEADLIRLIVAWKGEQ